MAAGVAHRGPRQHARRPGRRRGGGRRAAALHHPGGPDDGRARARCVGPFVRLVDARSGAGAQILDHCLLRECVVEAGASVGPFAHLRPGEPRRARGPRWATSWSSRRRTLGDGRQGPAPQLPRRRHDRARGEHRRRHHHLQLRRRRQAPDARSRPAPSSAATRTLVAPVDDRARAPTSARAAPSPRTCPRVRWPSAGPGRW